MTDEQLLSDFLKTKDHELYAILDERMRPRLYGLALNLLKSPEDAEDAVQDVFFKLLELGPPSEPFRSAESFLFKSLQNLCIDKKRSEDTDVMHNAETIDIAGQFDDDNMQHRAAGASNLPDRNSVLTEGQARALALQADAMSALEHLSLEQREAVSLYHCRSMTAAETAELLGISESTVEKRVEIGIKKLRKAFGVKIEGKTNSRSVKAINSDGQVVHTFAKLTDARQAGFNLKGVYRSVRRKMPYRDLTWSYANAS